MSQDERSIFWEVIVSVILNKNVYMNMCPVPNGFRDRAIWMYNSKIVDKKEILHVRTVSKTGIYCSSDKVGTVYIIRHTFENSNVSINVPCNSCEDMACYSFGCTLTFHYSGDNLHCVTKQFVSCIHFSSVHFTLHPPP